MEKRETERQRQRERRGGFVVYLKVPGTHQENFHTRKNDRTIPYPPTCFHNPPWVLVAALSSSKLLTYLPMALTHSTALNCPSVTFLTLVLIHIFLFPLLRSVYFTLLTSTPSSSYCDLLPSLIFSFHPSRLHPQLILASAYSLPPSLS